MNVTYISNGTEFVPMRHNITRKVYVLRYVMPLHRAYDISQVPDYVTQSKDLMDQEVKAVIELYPEAMFDVRLEWLQ